MNYVDLAIIALCTYLVIMGAIRGLIKEVLALVGLAAAVFVSYLFGELATVYAEKLVSGPWVRPLVYATLFIATLLIIRLLANALTKLSKFAALGTINRLLGALFGFTKALIILVLLAVLYEYITDIYAIGKPDEINNSIAYGYLSQAVSEIRPLFNQVSL